MEREKLYQISFVVSIGILAYVLYVTVFAFLNVQRGEASYGATLSGFAVIIVLVTFAAVASGVGLLVNRKRR